MQQDTSGYDHWNLLFSESEGRVRVDLADTPDSTQALTVPVRREGVNRVPRNRKGQLRVYEADLVASRAQPPYSPPPDLSERDLLWVLSATTREWASVVSRFGSEAWRTALALVRHGGVVLRCTVDDDLHVDAPVRWRLSHAWALQADELIAGLRGARDPLTVRAELVDLLRPVDELRYECELLASCTADSPLRVPEDSRTGARTWPVYEVVLRAASIWWPAHRAGERMTAKQLAGLALGGSKTWTPAKQTAFENLVELSFDMALDQADVDIRICGPLAWRIGAVAADASVARPWVALPGSAMRLAGEINYWARGVFLVENSDTFEKVCGISEITTKWLCIWGQGYVANQLVAFIDWLKPARLAAWGDLDADGIAIIADLGARLKRTVHPVGMEVDLWRAGPYWGQEPDGKARARAKAAKLAESGPIALRDLALAIAETGESCEQEPLYAKVLHRLPALLEQVPDLD